MNIAFLSTFYPFRGGIAQFNANLFKEFSTQHSITAFNFTRQYPGFLFPGKSQLVEAGDTADFIPSIRALDTINPISYIQTKNQILSINPDVLITRLWMPFFGPSLGYVAGKAKKKNIKTVALLDNVIPHERRPGDDALIRYYLNRHDGYVVMTEAVKKELLNFVPHANILLKPHPIYSHFGEKPSRQTACERLLLDPIKKYMLFFGFIRTYKGLDLLLNSLAHLPEHQHLIIAGECYGDFAPYQKLIDKLGLGDRVHQFIRYLPDTEVPAFFAAAEVCVLPYKSATQSGIAQVSYHFEVPLIVTNIGGLSEMIEDGETGYIIDAASVDQLTNGIARFFSENKKDLFAKNMHQQRERYSWHGFADAMIEFIESM